MGETGLPLDLRKQPLQRLSNGRGNVEHAQDQRSLRRGHSIVVRVRWKVDARDIVRESLDHGGSRKDPEQGFPRKAKSEADGLSDVQVGYLDFTHHAPAPVETMMVIDHPTIVGLKPNFSRQALKMGGRMAPKRPPMPQLC